MQHENLSIRGMSCEHCVKSVRTALTSLNGVTVKSVTIGSAEIEYDEQNIGRSEIARAIKDAGYAIATGSDER
ncbi:MAG TPA: cation transporter [Bacteroidota bacterium]|nr:cation transporter [Bacteroidota bacterium]